MEKNFRGFYWNKQEYFSIFGSNSSKKNHNEVFAEQIKKIIYNTFWVLIKNSRTADALLIQLIYEFKLRTSDFILLRFEV